jgi:hypothetical protein
LIPATAAIRPYSATFAIGQLDSVADSPQAVAAWWSALAEWEGPANSPRSLTRLVASDSAARFLFILSRAYLVACRADIIKAVQELKAPQNLSIISAGTQRDAELGDFVLPANASLQSVVGGARNALNVRIARLLMLAGLEEHVDMRHHLDEILTAHPPARRPQALSMSDHEVRRFIHRELARDPTAAHTNLLQQLRRSGWACEQKRFAGLFRHEKESL